MMIAWLHIDIQDRSTGFSPGIPKRFYFRVGFFLEDMRAAAYDLAILDDGTSNERVG